MRKFPVQFRLFSCDSGTALFRLSAVRRHDCGTGAWLHDGSDRLRLLEASTLIGIRHELGWALFAPEPNFDGRGLIKRSSILRIQYKIVATQTTSFQLVRRCLCVCEFRAVNQPRPRMGWNKMSNMANLWHRSSPGC